MSRRNAFWILFVIVLVGLGLRSWDLTARSLWFDEAFSWRLIQFPWREMLARAAQDVHPPFYYILLRSWTYVFDSSLLALRSFSVVWAGLSIVCMYGFTSAVARPFVSGKRDEARAVGLLSAAFLALSGWQISFAWEARMYTLGTTLALLSSWLLYRAVQVSLGSKHPTHSVLLWAGYTMTITLFLYTHYFAFFTAAAQLLFVIGIIIWQTRGRIIEIMQLPLTWWAAVCAVVAAALYSPWLPILLRQNAQVQQSYWVPAIGGWSIPDTFYRFILPTAKIPSHQGWGILTASLPIIATLLAWTLIVVWYPRSSRSRDFFPRAGNWLAALAGMTPFLLAISASFIGQSLYQDRFLVFAQAFILAAFALLIARFPNRAARQLGIGIACTVLLAGSLLFFQELDIPRRPGARGASLEITRQASPQDIVIVTSPFIYFSIAHYFDGSPKAPAPHLLSNTQEISHFAGGPILKSQDIVMPDVYQTSSAKTLWVVDTTGFGGSLTAPPAPWRLSDRQTYPEVFPYQGDVVVSRYAR